MREGRGILGVLAGLLGMFVGGFAIGRLASPVSPSISPVTTTPATSNTAVEFLQVATTEASETDLDHQRRSDLLQTIALQHQRILPSSARALWNVINESVKQSATEGSTNVKALARLVSFQDALDDGLLNSGSLADFDEAWQVRQEVECAIAPRRNAIIEHLKSTTPSLLGSKTGQDCAAAKKVLQEFSEFLDRENESLLMLVATMRTDSADLDLDSIFKSEGILLDTVRAAVQHEREYARSLGNQVKNGSGPLDPAESGKGEAYAAGQCENHRRSLAELDRVMAKLDLESWRQLRQIAAGHNQANDNKPGPPDTSEIPSVAISNSIAELQSELRRLQLAAYNLWALREIEAAETVDAWDGRLARLDQSLLEPAVAALYGSVYSRRIEAVKDPERRSGYVRRLFSSDRVPLSSF